jgi:hypothetical protein
MKHLAIPLFIGVALLFAPARLPACICEIYYDGSPRSMMHHARVVFVGEVLEVRPTTAAEREEGSNFYKVRLRVNRYWKGTKGGEVLVETDMTGCGPFFRVGEKYLVYGRGNKLNTSCTRTRNVEDAQEDLEAIGPGKESGAK